MKMKTKARALLVLCLLALSSGAQTLRITGSGGLQVAKFASPPAHNASCSTSAVNCAYLFTDASATGTCSGGGSAYAVCVDNGATFVATAGAATGLGDPGSNSVPYRNGSGSTIPGTANLIEGANSCTSVGAANAYACSLSPAIAAYSQGAIYWVKADSANTASATVQLNAISGPLTIVKMAGGINTVLAANDIRNGQWFGFVYDGSNAQMVSQPGTTAAAGGTGNAALLVTLAFSATPAFNAQNASAGTVVDFQASSNAPIVLTGNITSSTLSNATNGSILNFLFQQDGTGGRTVAMPSGFDVPLIHPAPNATTKLSYYWDGAHARLLTATSDTGYSACAEVAVPGSSPPAGNGYITCDSTRHTLFYVDPSGFKKIAVRTKCLTDQICAQDIGDVVGCTGGGTANAQTVTCTPANQALDNFLTVKWAPTNANTAATTLQVDSLAAKNLTKCGTTALASGDLAAGVIAEASYDGTQFELINPQAATCGGGGGGGGSLFTSQGTGFYFPYQASNVSSVNSVANTMYVIQASLPAMTAGRVAFIIALAQAGSHMGVAIYNSACNSLLASSTTGVATTSTGQVYPAFSSALALSTGTYNIAFSFDTNTVEWNDTSLFVAQALAEPSHSRYNTAANTVTWAGGNPTFPSTCGTLTAIGIGTDYPPSITLLP